MHDGYGNELEGIVAIDEKKLMGWRGSQWQLLASHRAISTSAG
jgi:hypothetical protein